MLQFMGSQRVGHDLVTEQKQWHFQRRLWPWSKINLWILIIHRRAVRKWQRLQSGKSLAKAAFDLCDPWVGSLPPGQQQQHLYMRSSFICCNDLHLSLLTVLNALSLFLLDPSLAPLLGFKGLISPSNELVMNTVFNTVFSDSEVSHPRHDESFF